MDIGEATFLVEEMFLNVKGSTWLPMDFWAYFYLRRCGMSAARIQNFIEECNARIRHRLEGPGRKMLLTLDTARVLDRGLTPAPGVTLSPLP